MNRTGLSTPRRHNFKKRLIRFISVFRSVFFIRIYNFLGELFKKRFDKIEKILIFIGHTRSGHTIVGSLLDAHPNITVATEAHLLDIIKHRHLTRWGLYYFLYTWSKWVSILLSNRSAGYSYSVENGFQGKSKGLKVIGDNKGRGSLLRIGENPKILDRLKEISGNDLKIIFSVRNPFDILTTQYIKSGGDIKNLDYDRLVKKIDRYFHQTSAIRDLIRSSKYSVKLFYHESLIERPRMIITELLEYLSVPISDKYLASSSSIIFKNPKKTRNDINWPIDLKKRVESYCQETCFLKCYSFES